MSEKVIFPGTKLVLVAYNYQQKCLLMFLFSFGLEKDA